MPGCCHLHTHSRYSFKDGQNQVEELVVRAKELGQPGIGLTDHGVLYGAPELFSATKKHEIKPVIGMEIYEPVPHEFDMERDGEIFKVKWADLGDQDRYYHLTLWVLNREGWENIVALHSLSYTSEYFPTLRGKPLIDRAHLEAHSGGLAVGLGCMASRTSVMLARGGNDLDPAYKAAQWYAEVFQGRCWMEVMGNTPEQIQLIRPQRKLAAKLGVPVVGTNDVHYRDQADGRENGPHHILVQSRRFKKADTEESGDRSDDGFGSWYGSDGFFLKSYDQWMQTSGIEAPDLDQTLAILDRVDFDFDVLPKPQPPIAAVPQPGDDEGFDIWLRMRREEDMAGAGT